MCTERTVAGAVFSSRLNVAQIGTVFSSLAELREAITSCGRDAFVANLVYHGSTPDTSRRRNDDDNDGVIYALICSVNLKTYVGQTCNFDIRMGQHRGRGGATCLKNAIEKYGWEKFVPVILLSGIEQQEELDWTEIAAIVSRFFVQKERLQY
jgi:predicted GIY-YIG superfamily endonuclease